jgi:MFS family permease
LSSSARPERSWAGYAACAWALLFAIPSFYWAAGGGVGTHTIAADVEELGLSDPWVLASTGAAKVLGGVLALALVRPWGRKIPRKLLLALGWGAAALLILYAGANFVDHGLMEAGVRDIPEALGSEALRWHLLLWDPWWLLGGILFALATKQFQSRTAGSPR